MKNEQKYKRKDIKQENKKKKRKKRKSIFKRILTFILIILILIIGLFVYKTYENGFIMGTECNVNIKKNKLCPKFADIPCVIDATKGGAIDEVYSIYEYLTASHIGIIKTGSYYNIKETIDFMIERYPILKDNESLMSYYKSIRKNDLLQYMRDDKDLLNFLQIRLIDLIDDIYPLQRNINGDYQKKLITECKYFDGFDPYTGEIISEIRSNDGSDNESIVESEGENTSA